jgi:hypothetical protein
MYNDVVLVRGESLYREQELLGPGESLCRCSGDVMR